MRAGLFTHTLTADVIQTDIVYFSFTLPSKLTPGRPIHLSPYKSSHFAQELVIWSGNLHKVYKHLKNDYLPLNPLTAMSIMDNR